MEVGEEMNPLFANAPHVDFKLNWKPKMMMQNFQSMMSNIKQLIAFESARENAGIPRYAGHATPIATPPNLGPDQQYTYRVLQLPLEDTKYFVLVMHPPKGWGNAEPLKFLFCLHNMYLEGFLQNNVWQIFKDAKLKGVNEVAFSKWIRRLPLKCNYNDLNPDYFTIKNGFYGQLNTLSVVPRCGRIDMEEVKVGLSRTIAVSEAIRFPALSRHIMFGFNSASESELKNETIDDIGKLQSDPNWKFFWDTVRDWKIYCKWILGGEENFKPAPNEGFPTFESVVAFIGVVMFVDIAKDE